MKNLVELVKLVRVEESKYTGVHAYFEMKCEVNDQWIDWEGDYISVDASPVYNDLDGIYPEDIAEGKRINMEILRDLTGMDSGYIKTALKVMEDAWLNKFDVISKATGYKITSMEIDLEGGEF